MNTFRVMAGAALFCLMAFSLSLGQDGPKGVRGEILGQFNEAAEKILQLIDAMPQEKFTWRPAEGVRSVSEVFMHVAGANYFFPTIFGAKPSGEFKREMATTVTKKDEVKKMVMSSVKYVTEAVSSMSDADLDKEVNMFGTKTTGRGVCMSLVSHIHEHLGQSIAYARMNGVVPPWSRSQ